MEEQYQKRKRKIERKQIDSSLPAVRKSLFVDFYTYFAVELGFIWWQFF